MQSDFSAFQSAFVNQKWIKDTGKNLASQNPTNLQTLWSAPQATSASVDLSLQAAKKATFSWANTSFDQRVQICHDFKAQIELNKDKLAECLRLETGKPLWDAKTEVAAMVGKIDISIKAHQERAGASAKNISEDKELKLEHRPHGIILVLGPYNFPMHLPNGHIVPALLAGNTVIFKPSEQTPICGALMTELWREANLPAGVLSTLQGDGELGKLLVDRKDIAGIFFTGSSSTGAKIHKQWSGSTSKIIALEMGGNNPLVIGNISDLAATAYSIIQSAFLSSGQRCTCARRLIVIRNSKTEALTDLLCKSISKIRLTLDHPNDGFMGPLINLSAAKIILDAQKNIIELGGKPLVTTIQPDKKLPFLTPGIIDVTNSNQPDQEYFGPLLQLKFVDNLEQAIEEANNTKFGLSAGLLSDDYSQWQQFFQHINAGIVNWNQPITGASSAVPFGGIGSSGNHRPSAYYAADYCAHPVSSIVSQKITLPPNLAPGVEI